MFTVRHELFGEGRPVGSIDLFAAISLNYVPRSQEVGDSWGLHCCAGPGEGGPGVRIGTIRGGTAYVMNDKGATVATFYLDAPPIDTDHKHT